MGQSMLARLIISKPWIVKASNIELYNIIIMLNLWCFVRTNTNVGRWGVEAGMHQTAKPVHVDADKASI